MNKFIKTLALGLIIGTGSVAAQTESNALILKVITIGVYSPQ